MRLELNGGKMIRKDLFCCGKGFNVFIEYKKRDEFYLTMCHDGFGIRLEDMIFKCRGCGAESKGAEDFELKELEGVEK